MKEESLQTIDIPRIKSLAHLVDEYALGEDFILAEVSGSRLESSRTLLEMLRYPFRFEGYIFFFVRKGNFTLDLNLSSYEVHERTLMVVVPGNIVKFPSFEASWMGGTEFIIGLISKEFMSGIRLDVGNLFQDGLRLWKGPCVTLQGEDLAVADEYTHLARLLLSSPDKKREMIGSLLTSFIYFSVGVWTRQMKCVPQEKSSSARVREVFEQFMKLVKEYHCSERGMAFYADKLCLTPKYLSKLVKQASGRSAPDWIDAFVILEAKNLLKYSDRSIKEIVYILHFPNQSVFYKFFKAHTGLTPTQYRKG